MGSSRLWVAAVLIAVVIPAAGLAQDLRRMPEGTSAELRGERSRVAAADYLIYQRAAFRAQQRAERIEARKWMGMSAQRPRVGSDSFYNELNSGYLFGWSDRTRDSVPW